ncbi:MAG: EAL domain-containing protein [Lachnospiraceae bacterium]
MSRKKILVVEDNELNRAMLSEILSNDYEVLEAENGQEALYVLEQNKNNIILILLDVMMPVMDGYTFLDRIKKDEEMALIPVIVTTQGDREEDEIAALAHGATDFVPKPYRPQVILHRVASLIKLRETAAMVNLFQYDRLTGLYTKEFFYRKVRERLDANPEKEYTILCSNFENFKWYNDTFGREAGDKMLVKGAEIFKERAGEKAICCRYSADRFLCLIDQERERIGREYFIKGRNNSSTKQIENISVKLGIYEITDRSISVEQMCDRVLLVVDSIKGKYNQHIAIYDDALREKLLREKAITDVMANALEEGQFTVYLQPKYSLYDNKMVGAEALVRWIHPEWGFMSPGEFIPLFEKNGFIPCLDQYVWESVCAKLRDWKEKGYPLLPVSVNVSRADIYQSHLVDTFCNLIKKYKIDPGYLHLEITESAYTEHPEQIITTIDELRKLGFIIEMDDFGSGYSSLNMLSQMTLDILKLDMKFIQNEMAKPVEQSILHDIISMAHRLHLSVVAEGVETRDQMKRLQAVRCDYAQGYFFARPMPVKEFEELLKLQCTKSVSPLSQNESSKRSLLILDEDEKYRERVRKHFEGTYQIFEASNVDSAFDCISKYSCEGISAILLSTTIPDKGAQMFLKKMSQNSSFWKVPVIGMVSCMEIQGDIGLETDDILCKNYPLAELGRHIERLIDIVAFSERENALKDEANQDYLTGLLNRRGLEVAISSLRKYELPLAVCLFDLDGMKKANDSCGHEMGDRMLKTFADMLRRQTREEDIRCRYGGDEFIVLLKNVKDAKDAMNKGMKICNSFRKQFEAEHIKAACSCGITLCTTDEVSSTSLIEQADQALYQAKRENRGGCCLANVHLEK